MARRVHDHEWVSQNALSARVDAGVGIPEDFVGQ